MMNDLIFVGGTLGLVVMSIAIFGTVALGVVVWLAGSDWAKRPRSGHPAPPRSR